MCIRDRSILVVTHDLGLAWNVADRIAVMYLGRIIEEGRTEDVLSHPKHPYTRALLSATPMADPFRTKERIVLRGELPSPIAPPSGCTFHPRCPSMTEICCKKPPEMSEIDGCQVACYHPKTYQ